MDSAELINKELIGLYSTLLTCIPGANVMDSAELINKELKCINVLIRLK